MTTILTYGTFDLFHIGHLRLLERLDQLGDRLVVGVSTDEFNQRKGKRSIISYEDRAAIVASSRHVDLVIPETEWDQKRRDIEEHNVDVFAIGADWSGRFDDLKDLCEVRYMDRTEGISSSQLKVKLATPAGVDLTVLQDAVSMLQQVVDNYSELP